VQQGECDVPTADKDAIAAPPAVSDVGLNVDDLLPGVDRAFLLANMRAQPLQPRALITVERIIAAARRIGVTSGYDALTLQAVAELANVRLGAIYRYFSTPDDLIRTMVRLWVAGQFDRYRAKLAETRFDSLESAVEHMAASVDRIVHLGEMEPGVPRRLLLKLLRDYHEIPLTELWTMAGDIRAKLLADGAAIADDPDAQARLAMAFAATSAHAKMTILHAPHLLRSVQFSETIRQYFRDALAPIGPGPPAAS
jgi:AcrR family transcriptional regulator